LGADVERLTTSPCDAPFDAVDPFPERFGGAVAPLGPGSIGRLGEMADIALPDDDGRNEAATGSASSENRLLTRSVDPPQLKHIWKAA
jgi:hypothetical protein